MKTNLLAAALTFTGSVLAGIVIGSVIDHYYLTTPWATIGGIGIGFTAGLFALLKQLSL